MTSSILLTSKQIEYIVSEVQEELQVYYEYTGEVEVVVILDGAVTFASELFKTRTVTRFNQHFLKINSYRGVRSYNPRCSFCGFNPSNIKNKHVLLVDDILDTGKTLSYANRMLQNMYPRTLDTCVLLHKVGNLENAVPIKFIGAKFYSNKFIYGYGMDYGYGEFRELKDIWIEK